MVDKIVILVKINNKTEKMSFNLKNLDDYIVNYFPQFVNIDKEKNDHCNYLHATKKFKKFFNDNYNEAYQRLVRCTSKEEVLTLVNDNIKDKRIFNNYSEDEIIYVSILTIIKLYIKNKYNNKEIIINKIKEQPDDLFDALENLPDSTKDNGLYVSIRKIFLDNLPKAFINDITHQCFECDKLLSCEKIKDVNKKSIDNYTFINSGYQLVINGISDIFIVNDCNNYFKNMNHNKSCLSMPKQVKEKKNKSKAVINNQFSFIDYNKIPTITNIEYKKLYDLMYTFVYKNYKSLFNKLIRCNNIDSIRKLIISNEKEYDRNITIFYELEKHPDLIVDIFTRVVIETYYTNQYGDNFRINNIFNDNIKYPDTFKETGMYDYAKDYCISILKPESVQKLVLK